MGNRHILRNDDPSNGIQCKYLECILHGVTHCSIAVRLNAHCTAHSSKNARMQVHRMTQLERFLFFSEPLQLHGPEPKKIQQYPHYSKISSFI